MTRKVNILACGGFGQNMMLALSTRPLFESIKDSLNLVAFDTSESNLKRFAGSAIEKQVKKVLVEKADGSGKRRAENHEAITAVATDFVNDNGVENGLVIIVSSASGGSGSKFADDLHELLAKRGHRVISMILGTDEDSEALGNTVKTIKTYRHKASLSDKNFAMFYGQNRFPVEGEEGKTYIDEARADELFVTNLEDIIMIGHPGNDTLDTMDQLRFLNYRTDAEGGLKGQGQLRFLSLISRGEKEDFPDDEDAPVSALSLLSKRGVTPQFPTGTGYSTRGYLSEGLTFTHDTVEVQYQLFSGRTGKLANQLAKQQKLYDDIQAKQAQASSGDEIKRSERDELSESGSFL